MKKSYFKKIKASILLQVVIISFLFISLTLFIQLLLNSRFELYKTDRDSKELFIELDYLDEIIRQEFKNIEEKINLGEVEKVEDLIDSNSKQDKIYLSLDERISRLGYKVYAEDLKKRLKENFKRTFNIHYVKEIKILGRGFYLFATIEYKVGSKKDLNSLYDGELKRMWIKENV